MSIQVYILVFIFGMIIILKSADLFTDGAEGIARALKIPRVIIGLTIVSVATTVPELTVSTFSSYMQAEGIAVGNALGSCLANIGLVLALAALIKPISFTRRTFEREMPILVVAATILYLLFIDYKLSSNEGVLLFILLIVFYIFLIFFEFKDKRRKEDTYLPHQQERPVKTSIVKFLVGIIGVVISAKYAIIPSGVNIARFLGVPEIVIGISMIAVGTSLPELFTAIVASSKKMGDLAIGNVIGANILNILLVLGVSSWVRPLAIDNQTLTITMPVMFVITLVMFLFSRTSLILTRKEGLGLFAIYIGYIIYIFKFAY